MVGLTPLKIKELFVAVRLSIPPLVESAPGVEPLRWIHPIQGAAEITVGVPVLGYTPYSIEMIIRGPPKVLLKINLEI